MEICFVNEDQDDLDAERYIRLLVAVTKSDPDNGPPEYQYVKKQANSLGIDIVPLWNDTSKHYLLEPIQVSRRVALVIIKDCIMLASLDGNFSLGEKEKVYRFAERLDVPRVDVDAVVSWLEDYERLQRRWHALTQRG
ncbi:MAG: hypothetical protein ABIL58_10695 [Pseudomonadota bacterium]